MDKITLIDTQIEAYAENHCSWPNQIAARIVRDTESELQFSDMLSGNQVSGLLRMLVMVSSARKVAEIGTFTGFATLAMAEALPDDGEIYTLEMNARYQAIADKNLPDSPASGKIRHLFGSARERIHELPDQLDLVFLDADKEHYPAYYEIILSKLRPGGLLILDNMFWYGGVLREEKDRKSQTIHSLNVKIQGDERVENILLTVRDGLMIVRKKP
jgi:caffeoyl-CoA O-methyltransferase